MGFTCTRETSIEEKSVDINISENKYIEEALNEHNILREKHNSNPLINNEDLNIIAKNYAKELFCSGKFYSNYTYKGEALGENIFLKKENKKPKEICKEWYSEKDNYNYYSEKFQKDCIHFTQLIWDASKEFGFGYMRSENKTCGVALYYPSGNRFFEFKKNVKKIKK